MLRKMNNFKVSLCIKSIFNNITTLHGSSHLTRKKGSGFFLWSLVMLGNMFVTLAYILVIRTRYNSDRIITRINANCQVNQVAFPAVSICNFNEVSFRQTAAITEILKNNNRTQLEIEDFYMNLPRLTNFRKIDKELGNYSEIMEILGNHYFNAESIMEEVLHIMHFLSHIDGQQACTLEVHQKCEHLLLHCAFNRKNRSCNEMFNLIKTYDGFCCAFNYAALNDGNMDVLSDDDDVEYYSDPSGGDERTSGILVTSESGRGSGLSVVLNVEPNDYPHWSLTPYHGAKILINDPKDYPEITVLYKYLATKESLDIKVEPMIFQSDDDIRLVPLAKRSCVFHDEIFFKLTGRFSTETCKTECKMKNYAEYCGCVPYKYPRDKTSRVCDFSDLDCLNNFRAFKIKGDKDCKPTCYIECRDKRYRITSDIMPLVADFYPRDVMEGHNISELSSLQVYFTKPSCNCYKKMLLIDFNYFIATYGGVFSLSFGASIITLFEIIYLLFSNILRFIRSSMKNKK